MAIPDIDPSGGAQIPTGVLVACTAAASYTLVVERSLTSGAGFVEIYAFPSASDGTEQSYRDELPLDGVVRFYRFRARRIGESDSPPSSEVSQAPRQL